MAHATLSSPTETHAAAAGIFPRSIQHASSTSPPTWNDENGGLGAGVGHVRSMSLNLSDLEEMEFAPPDAEGDSDTSAREPIEVHETFRKNARWSGGVKITVEATTFW